MSHLFKKKGHLSGMGMGSKKKKKEETGKAASHQVRDSARGGVPLLLEGGVGELPQKLLAYCGFK